MLWQACIAAHRCCHPCGGDLTGCAQKLHGGKTEYMEMLLQVERRNAWRAAQKDCANENIEPVDDKYLMVSATRLACAVQCTVAACGSTHAGHAAKLNTLPNAD